MSAGTYALAILQAYLSRIALASSEYGTACSSACNLGSGKRTSVKPLSNFTGTELIVNFPQQQEDLIALSEREREVLQCIARGLSSKQSAQEIGIAPRTVERHVENLRNKLNARNKPHLVARALSAGHIQ